MFRTLRSKLIFSYAAVSVLMLGLVLAVSLVLANDYAHKTGFRTLQEKRAIAFPLVRAVLADQRALGVKLPVLGNAVEDSMRAAKVRILLLDPDTLTIILDTQKNKTALQQPFPFRRPNDAETKLAAGNPITGTVTLPGDNARYQFIAQGPRDAAGKTPSGAPRPGQTVPRLLGQQIVVVAQPEPDVRGLLSEMKDFLVPGIAIALVISLGVAFFLARSLSKPLSRLAGAAGAMSRGEYDHRLPVVGRDEIATLTEQFNIMAQEVGQAHAMQRSFVANVSHDLKTPLTSIQGFSQAMLDGAIKDEEQYRQAAGIINDEAQRMTRLVGQLLLLSQLQSGLRTIELRPIEAGPLLGQLLLSMQPQAAAANVELIGRFSNRPALVLADSDKLKQAFGNIVDNAIKHTPHGGSVTVATSALPDGVEISVADTGKGIPEADLPHVMERFYQVDKSRSAAQVSSLGLGLAIAREIVQAHHGQISLESKEGEGTIVRVVLPSGGDPTHAGRTPITRRLLSPATRSKSADGNGGHSADGRHATGKSTSEVEQRGEATQAR